MRIVKNAFIETCLCTGFYTDGDTNTTPNCKLNIIDGRLQIGEYFFKRPRISKVDRDT